jgi:hypothetical protein
LAQRAAQRAPLDSHAPTPAARAARASCARAHVRARPQTLLAMLAYAGLFCIPWLYRQFRGTIDVLVCDVAHFLTLLLANAERWAYALAAGAAVLAWHVLAPGAGAGAGEGLAGLGGSGGSGGLMSAGASLVVRASAACGAAFSVLLWRLMAAG